MAALLSFVIAFFSVLFLVKVKQFHFALDKPNARSLHQHETPRTGGWGLMMGLLLAGLYIGGYKLWLLLVFGLMLVSLLDDVRGLSVGVRFFVHFVMASIFVFYFLATSNILLGVLLVLGIVWITNLYNFMDGSDGLAGGMAVIGFSAYAIQAYFAEGLNLAYFSASVASASLAFLIFNFNPAKIFMGDAGSIPLGFLAATIGIYGFHAHLWAWWFPLVVFSPFIVDATVTLIKRALRGEKVWQAHREHYYQKLVQLGLGHKKTAVFEYVLMLVASQVAFFMSSLSCIGVLVLMGLGALLYYYVMTYIDKRWSAFLKQ